MIGWPSANMVWLSEIRWVVCSCMKNLHWHHWRDVPSSWHHLLQDPGPEQQVLSSLHQSQAYPFLANLLRKLTWNVWLLKCTSGILPALGNRLFKRKQKKKNQGKKGFLSFYSVCMFVCLCVYLSVGALQTSTINIGGWNFDIDTYMWISQNGIFYFF